MGRPIQKRWFLTDDFNQGKIKITAKIAGFAFGEGVIIEQTGTRKYKVVVDGNVGDVRLVNKLVGAELEDGEAFLAVEVGVGSGNFLPASKLQQYSVAVHNLDGTISKYTWNNVAPEATIALVTEIVVPDYTVTFVIGDGTLVSGTLVQTVTKGSDAVAPVITPDTGFVHDGWDIAFDNVQGDLTVNAIYSLE